ncbi:histidine kinase [Pseudoxanthomonas putridarboris]|uniref:Histidine kinase n=1 Tax=Pseudoxanthomonas putridarboris TaxID=752605 RepID=A0ABU9IZ33_9GAMM
MPDPSPAHALLLQLLLQQEAERHAAGRALHNQVGQALSAIKMTAHLTLDETDAEQRRQDLLDIIRASDDTVAVLRDLHAALHPPQLETLGLEAALRAELERIAAQVGPVEASFEPLPASPAPPLPLVAFRIGQALARQAAAASAEPVQVSLAPNTDAGQAGFQLLVGAGAPFALADAPLLRALAASVGGDLAEPAGGHGARWRLRLPYAFAPTSGSASA